MRKTLPETVNVPSGPVIDQQLIYRGGMRWQLALMRLMSCLLCCLSSRLPPFPARWHAGAAAAFGGQETHGESEGTVKTYRLDPVRTAPISTAPPPFGTFGTN